MRRRVAMVVVLGCGAAVVPSAAEACPVCYGDIGGPAARGVNNGILTMLAVIGVVQIGFVAMFVGIWRRGKQLRERKESFKLIDGGVRSST